MTSPSEKRGKHLKALEKKKAAERERERELNLSGYLKLKKKQQKEKEVAPAPEKKVIRSNPKPITKKKTV